MTTATGLFLALVTIAAPTPRGEVLDFSSKRCGPCQMIAPTVARLNREGLPIRAIDVDENRQLSDRFHITSLPTFVLVVDGKEVDRHIGVLDESQLRAWIKRIPTTEPTLPAASSGGGAPFVADSRVSLGTAESTPFGQLAPSGNVGAVGGAPARTSLASGSSVRANDSPLTESLPGSTSGGKPMDSSVRLRVKIDGKINLGSGTIIHCENGVALIATCGHIFRGFNETSQIEINLFRQGSEPSFAGKLVKYDSEEADVGLVTMETSLQLPAIPVAKAAQRAQQKDQVLSVGCSGGQPPTAENIVVTELNPFLGPDNLECTGVPVQGRSGGGLFSSAGELVGICIASDPAKRRGIYAGLLALHEMLADSGYESLFRTPEPALLEPAVVAGAFPMSDTPAGAFPAHRESEASPEPSLLDSLSPANNDFRGAADSMAGFPSRMESAPPVSSSLPTGSPVKIGPEAADAEIVCIIRPRNQPESASQVVIINQASPKMLSYLRGEMGVSAGEVAAGGAVLSGELGRRSRESAIPTMGVSEVRSGLTNDDRRGEGVSSRGRPLLQSTTLTVAETPRKYVRTR